MGFPVGTDMVLPWERICGAKSLSLHAGGTPHHGKMAAGRKKKESEIFKTQNWERKLKEGGMMAAPSGASDPKTLIFSVQVGGDLITHKVIKSFVFALCPVSSVGVWATCSSTAGVWGCQPKELSAPIHYSLSELPGSHGEQGCCHSYFLLHGPQRSKAMQEDMGTRLSGHLITAEIHPPSKVMEEVMAGLLCTGAIWIWRIHWFGFVWFIE